MRCVHVLQWSFLLNSSVLGFVPKLHRRLALPMSLRSEVLSDLSKKKVVDLKVLLKSRGLKVSGTKAELIERLSSSPVSSPREAPHVVPQNAVKPLLGDAPPAVPRAQKAVKHSVADVPPAVPRAKNAAKSLLSDDDLFAPAGYSDTRQNMAYTASPSTASSSPVALSRPPPQQRSEQTSFSAADRPVDRPRGNGKVFDMQEDFGPRGHDYVQSDNFDNVKSVVDEAAVDALLSARLEHKLCKRFSEADELEDELLKMGVRVNDKQQEWHTFTRTGSELRSRETYAYVPGDFEHTVDLEEAERLVAQRNIFKRERRYEEGDALRDVLLEKGVMVSDRGRVWVVLHPTGHPYMPRRVEAVTPEAFARRGGKGKEGDRALIEELLLRIWEAKRVRDFNTADEARLELNGLGAAYFDDSFTWDLMGGEEGA